MNTAHANLGRLTDLIGRHGDPALLAWWRHGVEAFTSRESKTLCRALGLRGIGKDSISTQLARESRDYYIRAAFFKLPDTGSTRSRALELGRHIRRFESVNWTGSRREEKSPPERYTPIQRALFFAFKSGICMPSKLTALTAIVTAEIPSFERLRNDVKSSKVNNLEPA